MDVLGLYLGHTAREQKDAKGVLSIYLSIYLILIFPAI